MLDYVARYKTTPTTTTIILVVLALLGDPFPGQKKLQTAERYIV